MFWISPRRAVTGAALAALTFLAGLWLTPLPAHGMDFAEGAKAIAETCPGLVKRDFPKATPQDIEGVCSCMRDTITASAKDYPGTLPNKQQWADLGMRAIQQCAEPFARRDTEQRCVTNNTARQQVTRAAGISDAQFDRYCTCHVNLVFDEAAKGLNTNDPEARRAIQQKSLTQCVAPLRAEEAQNKKP